MFILANDDDPISILPSEIRKVPKSLEDVVRTTKFSKSEIRLLYKGFKQVCLIVLDEKTSINARVCLLIGMPKWCSD